MPTDYATLREEVDESHPLYDLLFQSWDWMSKSQKGYVADTIWRDRVFVEETFWQIGEKETEG